MTDINTNNQNNNEIPQNKKEEQENVGGLGSQEWPTPAEMRSQGPKRAAKVKIEGSSRTAPLFKRKGVSPYRRKGAQKPTLAKGMTPKVLVKRVESYEGLVNIVSYKEDAVSSPGTCGVIRTEPIPTGAVLLGTNGVVEATPVPTENMLPGTNDVAGATSSPTGKTARTGREEEEVFPSTSYALPMTQGDVNITKDQVEGDEEDGEMVIMSTDEETEVDVVKRKRGRPPTTGEHIGARQKREAEAKAKREAEAKARKEEKLEERTRKALDPTTQTAGKKWESFLEKEEDFREELSYAPTLDLQTRIMEKTAFMFRAADCSLNMKRNLVSGLREAAAATRAMMLILAGRAREVEKTSGPSEREKYLEKQVEELKRKVERLEKQSSPPPESPTPSFPRRTAKRRRMAIESEEEVDVSAPSTWNTAYPLPFQSTTKGREKREGGKTSHDSSRYCDGPSLKGIVR